MVEFDSLLTIHLSSKSRRNDLTDDSRDEHRMRNTRD